MPQFITNRTFPLRPAAFRSATLVPASDGATGQRSWWLPLLLMVVLLAVPLHVAGQTTFATITGMITDPNGAAVAQATLVATHQANHYRYSTKSNELGYYTLPDLEQGEYVLSAIAPGFKEYIAGGISLVARDVRRLDIPLQLGTVSTSIEVDAPAALIETETARIGDVKPNQTLISMPMNSTNPWAMFGLTPAVLLSGDGNYVVKINGSWANQVDMNIDGGSMMNGEPTQNVIGPIAPRNETIQEFRIDVSNNSAEYSGVGGITFISKTGTNDIHGSAYDIYSTPWFRARNPFASARGTGVSHLIGYSTGAPILIPKIYDGRNRTFFFFAMETSRGNSTQQVLNPTVPLAPWRTGDFSGLLPGTVVKDPSNGGNPFPGNQIPANRINPVAVALENRFYPLPNYGNTSTLVSQNYRQLVVVPYFPATYMSGRIDHRFSDKLTFFARYNFDRQHSIAEQDNLPTLGLDWNARNTRAFASSFTSTLRSNLVNEFRVGYSFNNNLYAGPVMGLQQVQQLGLTGLVPNLPNISGLFNFSFTGLGVTGLTQQAWRSPGDRNLPIQFQDSLSWVRGRHSIKMGVQFERIGFSQAVASANLFGNDTFSNRFTNFPYADFLLGIPSTAARAPAPALDARTWHGYDGFIQDDVKVTPSLTVNAGLRYELHLPWKEDQNRLAVFDPNLGKIVVPDGAQGLVSPLLPQSYVSVVTASQAGDGWDSTSLLHADKHDFSPRLGLAYKPWGPNTVIRSGFGIYFDIVPPVPSAAGAPYVISEPTFTNPANAPTVILPVVFPANVGGPTTIGLPGGMSPNFRQPYSLQYNFTIEHQHWNTGFRVSYIGNGSREAAYSVNMNQPAPSTGLFINKALLFPNYPSGVTYTRNGIGHDYNSLNMEAHRQFRSGFSYQASWVWSRDIAYDATYTSNPEYAYNEARERAVSYDMPKNRVSGNFIYQLPFGKGRPFLPSAGRLLNLAVGGWQISAIFNVFSGQFLTPSWTGPDPTGTYYTGSSTPAIVTIRPNEIGNPNLPPDQRSVHQWFNPAAFAAPQQGSFGNSANTVIKGPGSWILNTGLYKYITLTEHLRLRWDFTGTNIANHPNWSNPATNITTLAQVGVISGVDGYNSVDPTGPRSMLTSIRVEW